MMSCATAIKPPGGKSESYKEASTLLAEGERRLPSFLLVIHSEGWGLYIPSHSLQVAIRHCSQDAFIHAFMGSTSVATSKSETSTDSDSTKGILKSLTQYDDP